MAIGRISGQMLKANLERSGTDLAFETNLLALDVSNSRVGIGTAAPATTLHVSATDAIRIASGTTAQRPGTPANGDIRYNSTLSTIEGYVGGATWANMASGDTLKDADSDTKVQVEESSDEDTIRFDAGGSEIMAMNASGLSFTAGGITSNLTITGNLTVNGTTTTIDSTTLTIEDPLIQLAKNNSGGAANTFDQGLFLNRGSDANVSFLWDESADQFVTAVTAGEDGTTAGNVTIDSVASLNTVNTGGASWTTACTFNDASGADVDFRMESNSNTHAFFLDGSANAIGINTSSPTFELDGSGSTNAWRLPVGTSGQRPTGATGIIRFNTTTGGYEGCTDGSTYVAIATSSGTAPTISKVSATGDGSTTVFAGFFSTAPAAVANALVFIDNVYQEPTENYTVSGTNITFTSAPHSSARIFGIVGFDNTALVTGGVARTESTSVNFTSSATTIMSFTVASYRAAELFINLQDSANTEYACMKANVTHNGTTAFGNVYGVVNTGSSDLATITYTISGGSVLVQAVSSGGVTAATVQYSLSA
jgi:hypothetical protein